MDRAIDTDKQSIKDLLIKNGWEDGRAGNYYFGSGRPHLHLVVDYRDNNQQVDSLRHIVPYIQYLGLTYHGVSQDIEIVSNGKPKQIKITLQDALKKLNSEEAEKIQAKVNDLTGMDINYKMDKW